MHPPQTHSRDGLGAWFSNFCLFAVLALFSTLLFLQGGLHSEGYTPSFPLEELLWASIDARSLYPILFMYSMAFSSVYQEQGSQLANVAKKEIVRIEIILDTTFSKKSHPILDPNFALSFHGFPAFLCHQTLLTRTVPHPVRMLKKQASQLNAVGIQEVGHRTDTFFFARKIKKREMLFNIPRN